MYNSIKETLNMVSDIYCTQNNNKLFILFVVWNIELMHMFLLNTLINLLFTSRIKFAATLHNRFQIMFHEYVDDYVTFGFYNNGK